MKTSEAVARRQSIRAFLPTPVDRAVLERVLDRARFAPSGGNVQPWEAVVVQGEPLQELFREVARRQAEGNIPQEHASYPDNLADPWMDRRRRCGKALYDAVGLERGDKAGRHAQAQRNFVAFDAPCLMINHMPRFMRPSQWADMGIWLQTVMLLLQEEGLDTCAQGAWAYVGSVVREVLQIPEEHVIYCGLAIGHADPNAPVNHFRTERAEVHETVRFVGM